MNDYPRDWPEIARVVKKAAAWRCIRCDHSHDIASGHVLTVHHLDGDKANCRWWNLAALCQRCHLYIQGTVKMDQPFFLEHTDWMKPYAAGFYAFKYLREELPRDQVEAWMEELLALECVA